MTRNFDVAPLFDWRQVHSPLIEGMDWRQSPEESILTIKGAFAAVPVEEWRRAVATRRDGMDPRDSLILEAGSAERPLILKHLLALGSVGTQQYKIWANEYRPEAWRDTPGGRHVERYHNHRFSIVSLMLREGYTSDELVYPPGSMPTNSMTDPDAQTWGVDRQGLERRTNTYREGDVMSLHSDEIHRLREIQPGTVSLIVEMPRVREFGIVFDETAADPDIVFYDMGGNYGMMADEFNRNVPSRFV